MTCHEGVTRDVPRSSRVSHATHTTPHHTKSLVAVACGRENQSIHSSATLPRVAAPTHGWAADAAGIGGGC